MARFLGKLISNRGNEITRLGSREINVSAQGWEIGAKVQCAYSYGEHRDNAHIILNGGTRGKIEELSLGKWVISEGKFYLDDEQLKNQIIMLLSKSPDYIREAVINHLVRGINSTEELKKW